MSKSTDALISGLKEIAESFAAQKSLTEVQAQIADLYTIKANLQEENARLVANNQTAAGELAKTKAENAEEYQNQQNVVSKLISDANAEARNIVAKAKQDADELISTANKTLGDIALKYDQFERKLQEKYDQIDAQNKVLADLNFAIDQIKKKL